MTSSSPPSAGAAPKPMPMAIMRNAHEVIRGAMTDIQSHLDKGDPNEAKDVWINLQRFEKLHMSMEEGVGDVGAAGMFQLMDDHAENAATKGGLRDQHVNLTKLEQDVEASLVTTPDLEAARTAFSKFAALNEDHLVQEEKIMMPCVQKIVKAGHPVKKYILTYLMPVLTNNEEDLKFFIQFANQILEQHEEKMPRIRVFDQALWAVATPEQWQQWKVWIKEALSATKYEEVMGQIQAFVDEQQQAKKVAAAQKEESVAPLKEPKWMALTRNPVEC